MKVYKIPFSNISQVSKRDKTYSTEQISLKPFYKYSPQLDSFKQIIADKKKENIDRACLVEVLEEQYKNLSPAKKVKENIQNLSSENTFTVTTAHQPSLFTGPLYYIYKIVSTLKLAKALQEKYPQFKFVPLFITGGEDHDFEEVNHVHLFNKTLVWQSNEKGSVATMQTKQITPVLSELEKLLGDRPNTKEIFNLIYTTHTQNVIYSKATLALVHELFKDYGLVVLNTMHPKLKALLKPIIKEELFQQTSKQHVDKTIISLKEQGFKGQATPRKINLFYLQDQLRERIVLEDDKFKVLNTTIEFSTKEMEKEIEAYPERFSPNVILRPIYQEKILPNLAYIGGGGELAYWMERKTQFEHFKINFPMLVRRHSVLWINKNNAKKLNKLNLTPDSIFNETHQLIKFFIKENTENEINLLEEQKSLTTIFKNIKQKTKKIDPSLEKSVAAEEAKLQKSIGNLEARLLKAEKRKHQTALSQIENLKEKLFPNNGLQERHDNFISMYLNYGEDFIATLFDVFEPLEKDFLVIVDNE